MDDLSCVAAFAEGCCDPRDAGVSELRVGRAAQDELVDPSSSEADVLESQGRRRRLLSSAGCAGDHGMAWDLSCLTAAARNVRGI